MSANNQINLHLVSLKKLGITVTNKQAFANAVDNYGYDEFISQYLDFFLKNCPEQPADFRDIQQLYQLDQSLKNVMKISLQLFEQTFKTALTDAISQQFDPANLTKLFAASYRLQNSRVIRRGDLKARIRHIKQHYLEPFPGYRASNNDQLTPWILVKEMSFGVASNAFFLLDAKTKAKILRQLFQTPLSCVDCEHLLNELKIFRERAAHNYRLLGIKIKQSFLYLTVLHDLSLLNNREPFQYALHHLQPLLAHYLIQHPEQDEMIHQNLGRLN